jgi:hypothetical protein
MRRGAQSPSGVLAETCASSRICQLEDSAGGSVNSPHRAHRAELELEVRVAGGVTNRRRECAILPPLIASVAVDAFIRTQSCA